MTPTTIEPTTTPDPELDPDLDPDLDLEPGSGSGSGSGELDVAGDVDVFGVRGEDHLSTSTTGENR